MQDFVRSLKKRTFRLCVDVERGESRHCLPAGVYSAIVERKKDNREEEEEENRATWKQKTEAHRVATSEYTFRLALKPVDSKPVRRDQRLKRMGTVCALLLLMGLIYKKTILSAERVFVSKQSDSLSFFAARWINASLLLGEKFRGRGGLVLAASERKRS